MIQLATRNNLLFLHYLQDFAIIMYENDYNFEFLHCICKFVHIIKTQYESQ